MVIGITGGVGTGKSTVAKFLKEFSKGKIINMDELGWKVLETKKTELISAFGKKILTGGKVDRKKLGKIVFGNNRKLSLLNSIIWPALIKELKCCITKTPKNTVKIVDCALIYEWQIEAWFDKIVLVTSSYENRMKWLKGLKYNKKVIDGIIKSQLTDSMKSADIVIKNDMDLKALQSKIKKVWLSLKPKKNVK